MGDIVQKLIGGTVMLILLVEVVCWAYVPWEGHRVEYVRALVALGDAWLCCKDS